MLWFVLVTITAFAALLAAKFYWCSRFIAMVRREAPPSFESELPQALVILCLRGPDPFLRQTLQCLCAQTVQNYDLRVIVDSETDPAWDIVQEFVEHSGETRIGIRVLHRRLKTCSLKVSALIQEIAELDERYGAVVLVDADAIPSPNWLRDLLTPLADPQVGATCGLRWYMPAKRSLADLVRCMWGAGAMEQMYQFQIAWGGSFALKRELFERTNLLDRWSKCFSEDTSINRSLDELNLSLRHVPVMLVNKESTSLSGCFEFIRRQLFCALRHHPNWLGIAMYAFANFGVVLAAFTLAIYSACFGEWVAAGWLCGSVLSYAIGVGLMTVWEDAVVRNRVLAQGGELEPFHPESLLTLPFVVVFYAACWISALTLRRIRWRGISYDLLPGGRLQVVEDRPYCDVTLCRSEATVL
ncbi:MAG: glycosyltransferase family 2 protein [Candidatus Saccharimonas sp.]|nr:glycosyltransferase family 2 protein [Planctomycetaceae bacterium]